MNSHVQGRGPPTADNFSLLRNHGALPPVARLALTSCPRRAPTDCGRCACLCFALPCFTFSVTQLLHVAMTCVIILPVAGDTPRLSVLSFQQRQKPL